MLRTYCIAVFVFIVGCSEVAKPHATADHHASASQSALLGDDLVVDGTLLTLDGDHIYDNVIVINGGLLQITDYDGSGTTGFLTLRARESISVDATSSIVADAAGFRAGSGANQAGEGPGAGGAGTTDGGGGAGHGGIGGQGTGDATCIPDGAAGTAYGSNDLDDVTMGSGGGGAIDNSAGGDGGGAIVLAAPSIHIEGAVSANGGDGQPQPTGGAGDGGGGGAGGSVTLITDSLDCGLTGFVSASGGRGGNQAADGGGGGGGRIKFSALNIVNACTTYALAGQTPDCPDDPPNYLAAAEGVVTANDGVGLSALCGNSTTEAWEGCDDGGTANDDGCNSTCLIENNSLLYQCEFGSQCASGICDGAEGNPGTCIACTDDNSGDNPDSACDTNPDRFCDTTGPNPVCTAAFCTDDETGTTADTGCNVMPFYFCDVSENINNPGCIAGCTDVGSGEADVGCSALVESGSANACDESGSNPVCVDCIDIGDCTGGDGCNPANHTCEPGCFENDDCGGSTPICNLGGGTPGICVECLVVEDCPGSGRICVATVCRFDSDGDGVPNSTECPQEPTCPDSDGDGDSDQLDTDSDNDGIEDGDECSDPGAGCLDADSDDLPDYLESNVIDTDGDGDSDQEDADDDNDATATSIECGDVPYCPDVDSDGIPDHLDGSGSAGNSGDSDGDGRSDAAECPDGYICPDTDENGVPDYFQADEPEPEPPDASIDAGDAGADAQSPNGNSGMADSGCSANAALNGPLDLSLLVLLFLGLALRLRTLRKLKEPLL